MTTPTIGGRRSDAAFPSLRRALAGWRPPTGRREFWLTQALVLFIAVGHSSIEVLFAGEAHEALYLLPISLFVIPIMYAALYFGLRGAVWTTVWCSVLSAPNVLFVHDDMERWGEFAQLLGIAFAAFFVGWWVDRERSARQEVEERERARRASEEQYRAIFDTVDEPIALVAADGTVVEANAAAATLFRTSAADVRGRPLPESIRIGVARLRARARPRGDHVRAVRFEHAGAWIDAHGTLIIDPRGRELLQLILRDVTVEHEREQGLEGVARQALAAREAEQRRIAREIHDGPVQSLVLLVRELDALAAARPESTDAERARAVAIDVTDQLRRVSRDLRPSILDDLGLPTALGALVHQLGDRTGIRARLVVTGTPVRLAPGVELTLLRISEEALRNVERHSGARSARIRLSFSSRGVTLTIADTGRGMSPIPSASALMASSHLGLIGMRERARLAGASFSVHAPRSGGLVVKVVVPGSVARRQPDSAEGALVSDGVAI